MVEIVLGRDVVKLDRPEAFEETLLSHSTNSHTGMVKILLERDDVDPNRPDIYDKNWLSCAFENGH